MLPSQAVADIRAHGIDDAPAYRGEPGTIPEGAQPTRLPYKQFLHYFGGYGSRNARRNDDMTFQRAHTFEWRIPADAPVSYITWERGGVVMGWLWWNDTLDAAWHIPNVTEPGSRIEDGITLQFNHPWAWRMADLHEDGVSASRAIQELMNVGPNDDGSIVPPQQPLIAQNLRHLQEVTGSAAYEEAQKRYMHDWRAETSAREAAERIYYAARPDEAEAPPTAPPTPPLASAPAVAQKAPSAKRQAPRWPLGRGSES
ncbi:hypothetical protein [Frondihabitans peucedani]|uniref:Uncharacterized protein n=1 Tax=Frondihabitans peucedani TaxID=598626 RepID=A0ABP8E3P5_9MICO